MWYASRGDIEIQRCRINRARWLRTPIAPPANALCSPALECTVKATGGIVAAALVAASDRHSRFVVWEQRSCRGLARVRRRRVRFVRNRRRDPRRRQGRRRRPFAHGMVVSIGIHTAKLTGSPSATRGDDKRRIYGVLNVAAGETSHLPASCRPWAGPLLPDRRAGRPVSPAVHPRIVLLVASGTAVALGAAR